MADDDLSIDQKKSSRMFWITIIIGGVLFLVLVILGTLYAMDRIGGPNQPSQNPEAADASKSDHGSDAIYYPLTAFTVNFRPGEGARFMQVNMTALARSKEVVSAMEKHDPVIRNNLLLLLAGQIPAGLQTRDGKEELRKLVLKEMQTILEQRTGNKGVEEVFFTGFVMQ